MSIDPLRIRVVADMPVRRSGAWVLYWMIANRRPYWNFALQRAVNAAHELDRPLIVLEPLRCNYPWASDRLHQFVIHGMASNAQYFEDTNVLYYPYVEPARGAGMGLVAALAATACIVVTDDFPCFFLPGMVERTARSLGVRVECVDSNGLLPLGASAAALPTAHAFRRHLQKSLPVHLGRFPMTEPVRGQRFPTLQSSLRKITRRWPPATLALLQGDAHALAQLPIDHTVAVVPTYGGWKSAAQVVKSFLSTRLDRYLTERNEPEQDATSGLSPYLHFGHVGVWEVVSGVMKRERWTAATLGEKANGKREGWWSMSPAAESFLDELITWRELGYHFCHHRPDYDRYESLPNWAQATLDNHSHDPRAYIYSREQFDAARTHDPLWNAAQTQLVREGRMHNYLRMLWGKKILEWSATPREALATMIHLNNRYALDGRDPNSYSGIFWVLGRFDRPWAPQRPIFGCVRYMSSENTARKFSVKDYVRRYTNDKQAALW